MAAARGVARPRPAPPGSAPPGSAPRRARILLVAPQPFFELRGTPLNVLQMLRALCGAGYEVHLVTYGLGEPVAIDGLVHHRIATPPWIRRVRPGFSAAKVPLDALLAARVWRLLLTQRFDVVHAIEESIFFTLPAARLRGVPVIYDLDSSIPDQLEYSGAVRSGALLRVARAAERTAVRQSRLAITVCQALTDRVVECAPGHDVVQIEDAPLAESLRAPDPAAVAGLRARHGDGPFALYTGNLASYQGVDLLLDALPTLRRLVPEARVLIVGGEPEEIERARTSLQARNMVDGVVFAGKEPPTLMADYMALATVLVSPRRSGTNTPLKLYTYMHSAVPIVATDIESHRQVLDDGTAVLCAPEPEALGTAIAAVIEDPAGYAARAAAAHARVNERYSPAIFERKLLDAYARLLERDE